MKILVGQNALQEVNGNSSQNIGRAAKHAYVKYTITFCSFLLVFIRTMVEKNFT